MIISDSLFAYSMIIKTIPMVTTKSFRKKFGMIEEHHYRENLFRIGEDEIISELIIVTHNTPMLSHPIRGVNQPQIRNELGTRKIRGVRAVNDTTYSTDSTVLVVSIASLLL